MDSMATDEGRDLARQLSQQSTEVARVSGRRPLLDALQRISGGRWGRRRSWTVVPELDAPWQDTLSAERTGWRMRQANLPHDHGIFAVDYQICHACRLAWVENPHTEPGYQRCGLAAAALASLRSEHPGLSWHTLGGHLRESRPFWNAVGPDVTGGYEQRPLCAHAVQG